MIRQADRLIYTEMMDTTPLVYIGINLAHDSYDHDREAVIDAALAAGVDHMVITGSSLPSIQAAIVLCESRPAVFRTTAGIHPHHASGVDTQVVAALRQFLAHPLVAAVGECGLDYFRDFSPRHEQRLAFERQLQLAIDHDKPLFLHQREAHRDFMDMLRPALPQIPAAVLHCFTGGRAELEECLEAGLQVGITGWICDERRGEALREAVPHLPLDRLMVETDGPYLLPRDLPTKPSSRRNEPKYLRHIVETISRIMERPAAAVATASTINARRFFGF